MISERGNLQNRQIHRDRQRTVATRDWWQGRGDRERSLHGYGFLFGVMKVRAKLRQRLHSIVNALNASEFLNG